MLSVFNMPLFSIWYRCIGDCMAFLLLDFVCLHVRKYICIHLVSHRENKYLTRVLYCVRFIPLIFYLIEGVQIHSAVT